MLVFRTYDHASLCLRLVERASISHCSDRGTRMMRREEEGMDACLLLPDQCLYPHQVRYGGETGIQKKMLVPRS